MSKIVYDNCQRLDIGFVDLFYNFWIQKSHHFYDVWIQEFFCQYLQFLDPEAAVFLQFLDPKTAPFLQFLDPEFLQHPYDSTGADYKSKGGVVYLLVCIR